MRPPTPTGNRSPFLWVLRMKLAVGMLEGLGGLIWAGAMFHGGISGLLAFAAFVAAVFYATFRKVPQ